MTRIQKRKADFIKRRKEKRAKAAAQKVLIARQQLEGLQIKFQETASNSKNQYETVEEETAAAEEDVTSYLKSMMTFFPKLLCSLSKVSDFREPGKVKHKVEVILLLGILSFAFQKMSRRQSTKELTTPTFLSNLRILLPELESLPHFDTINRFLENVDINELEDIYFDLISDFIKSKKFIKYLTNNCYPIAFDGTQKYKYDFLWAEECQCHKKNGKKQYYCYCVEAFLVLPNGMNIPFATEFLSYIDGDVTSAKQDCEVKAFRRLATKIKNRYPRLKIIAVLDGLYPNGNILALCLKNNWEYMIVLKDKSLKTVWAEFLALKDIDDENNRLKRHWGDRSQEFNWVNKIEYEYDNAKKRIKVNLVVCHEEWEEIGKDGITIKKCSKHAWLSSEPLNSSNVHYRCNLCARHRWGIESGILLEKKYGYNYEHTFSFNWNASRAYHILMHLACMINTLAQYGSMTRKLFVKKGLQAAIKYLDETFRKTLLDVERIQNVLSKKYQVRFP